MADDILGTAHHPPSDQNVADNNIPNGKTNHYAADPEAQDMVIESLRGQIQDLFSQVTQLNSKLVKSYDRVSDLEDNLHVTSAQLRTSSVKISQLELERTQHLAALNTGLLVEKHHVTTELNRLMEKATEEAAHRGQAESARAAIEKELDDLSAALFNQANTMVAEARYAQHLSERKAIDAEQALKSAEEAVGAMQHQVQILQEDKETAEGKAAEMLSLLESGGDNWVSGRRFDPLLPSHRLFGSHLPYQEFVSFVTHLRQLHMSSQSHPAMATILSLPFLTRLSTEDSEPTLRLDLAPSLSWLTRRSVLAAIHTGQLTIEPMSFATLVAESSQLSNAGITAAHNENIPCALCGTNIFSQSPWTNTNTTRSSSNPLVSMAHSYSGSIGSASSWSANLFKKNPAHSTPPPAYSSFNARTDRVSSSPIYPSQVYIFRVSSNQVSSHLSSLQLLKSSGPPSTALGSPTHSSLAYTPPLPHTHSGGTPTQSSSTIYPLCTSGWCLARLRSTCSLWAFVRTGIVEKIWEEEISNITETPSSRKASVPQGQTNGTLGTEKSAISPKKKGLWGFASAIGASWSENVGDKDKARKPSSRSGTPVQEKDEKKEAKARTLPPPPPRHPQEQSSVPPPPVPKRSESRARTPIPPSTPTPEPIIPLETATRSPELAGSSISDSTKALYQKSISSPEIPSHLTVTSVLRTIYPTEPAESGASDSIKALNEKPTSSPEIPSPHLAITSMSTPPVSPNRPHHHVTPSTPPPPIPPRAVKRLSTSVARPNTPSSVPLPESRPDTPVIGSAIPNSPSHKASPALVSSPAADAPPPIPRRAASRRKLTEENNSRSESPVVATAAPVAPSFPAKNHEDQTQSGATLTSPSQTQLDTVKETAEEAKVEDDKDTRMKKVIEPPIEVKAMPSTSSHTSMTSGEEVFLDAEDGSLAVGDENEEEKEKKREENEGKEEKEEEGKKEEEENKADQGEEEDKEKEDEAEVKTVQEEKESKERLEEETRQEKGNDAQYNNQAPISLNEDDIPVPTYQASPPRLPPRRSDPVNKSREVEKARRLSSDGSSEVSEEGETVYIGDRTWEERVWKELTKLREDMYWARVGAVRS